MTHFDIGYFSMFATSKRTISARNAAEAIRIYAKANKWKPQTVKPHPGLGNDIYTYGPRTIKAKETT